jgi:hypothetical protein
MSRDNDQRKGVLRSGFCILTTRQLILRYRPAAFFFVGDKIPVVSYPLVAPKQPFMNSSPSHTLQNRQCKCNTSMRRVHATNVAVEKQLSVIHCECVFVALAMQHAMRVRHIFICGLSASAAFFHVIS